MKRTGVYKDHVVATLDEDPKFILEDVRDALRIHQGSIDSYTYPASVLAEEKGMAQQRPEITEEFERNRAKIIETLQAIPGYFFQLYDLPRNSGIDVGCGSTGLMRNTLLADQINHHGWAEIDANPHAVAANRILHPDSAIVVGSYHRLRQMDLEGRLNMVTGLSSLDATAFLDYAVGEIASALKPGGWLFHMQDVRPGNGICFQALENEGLTPPFQMESADICGKNILSFEVRGEKISVVELFRRRMATALQKTPSLSPVLNSWVVARRPARPEYMESKHPGASKTYYMNMLLEHLRYPEPVEEAFAVVTLARKK